MLFQLRQGSGYAAAAETDAEGIQPLFIEGPRQQQDSCLCNQVGTKCVNRSPQQGREGDRPGFGPIPAEQIQMRSEKCVKMLEVLANGL